MLIKITPAVYCSPGAKSPSSTMLTSCLLPNVAAHIDSYHDGGNQVTTVIFLLATKNIIELGAYPSRLMYTM
jgi:hypothetical protein